MKRFSYRPLFSSSYRGAGALLRFASSFFPACLKIAGTFGMFLGGMDARARRRFLCLARFMALRDGVPLLYNTRNGTNGDKLFNINLKLF
jgi:hypothetical protein